TGPEYGHIYDHFAITYEYEGGARLFATCRQQVGCANEISAQVLGMKGRAALNSSRRAGGPRIEAGATWRHDGPPADVFQAEHDALFASIRRASRSTTVRTWRRAHSWRSWAGWRRIPARSSPGSRRSARRKTCRRRGTIGRSRSRSRP